MIKQKNKLIKIYNSGRISGLSRENVVNKFAEADETIKAGGFLPVNPLKSWVPEWCPWLVHMAADIILLMRCDAIYMQKDWEQSRGARIEKKIAEKIGLKILYQIEREINTKDVNERWERREAFVNMFLRSVKFKFKGNDQVTVNKVMEIAREFGVTWKWEPDREEYPFYPAYGLLYIFEDPNDGLLYFAHGGSYENFKDSTSEKEIAPDVLLNAYEAYKRKEEGIYG